VRHNDFEKSHYAKDRCDVKIGECRCCGDLRHYDVVFNGKAMSARMTLDSTIHAWRSQTSSIFFGDNEEHYFTWLPAVPEGEVVADVICAGTKELHHKGSGYHDHNWGNLFMPKLMHHWYWGRAKTGDYKVISFWITAGKKYGYKDHDFFIIAKDGEIPGNNANHTLRFLPEDRYIDEYTGKPVYLRIHHRVR